MNSESPATSPIPKTGAGGESTRVFMITLCRLTKPVSIQPPRSPQLASFTFFTTRLRQRDGGEQLYLHMGYFATLSDAQLWAQRLRARYPNAIATPAPLAFRLQTDSEVLALQTTTAQIHSGGKFPPVRGDFLSDTQVMRILETRHTEGAGSVTNERTETPAELLRPDDTETRRTLKDAVVAGLPVPFAVQLEWSVQPIDAGRVPLLDIFRGYTLYRTEKRRGGRYCYFLRVGFFADPPSAKEFVYQVRSTFASAAVVPVTEQEFLHADEARIDTLAPAGPLQQGVDAEPNSDQSARSDFRATAVSKRKARSSKETLEETLELLAQRETWLQPDPMNDSGIRHLKVSFEDRYMKPSKKQKLPIR